MGNFNRKYIIREAESILEECNKKFSSEKNDKNKILNLKIQNKRQKRKIVFWRIVTGVLTVSLIIAII